MRQQRLHQLEPAFGRLHPVDGRDQDALAPEVGARIAEAIAAQAAPYTAPTSARDRTRRATADIDCVRSVPEH
jgi:hypothetical protein